MLVQGFRPFSERGEAFWCRDLRHRVSTPLGTPPGRIPPMRVVRGTGVRLLPSNAFKATHSHKAVFVCTRAEAQPSTGLHQQPRSVREIEPRDVCSIRNVVNMVRRVAFDLVLAIYCVARKGRWVTRHEPVSMKGRLKPVMAVYSYGRKMVFA